MAWMLLTTTWIDAPSWPVAAPEMARALIVRSGDGDGVRRMIDTDCIGGDLDVGGGLGVVAVPVSHGQSDP